MKSRVAAIVTLADGVKVATVASRTGATIAGAFSVTLPVDVAPCVVTNLPAGAGYAVTSTVVTVMSTAGAGADGGVDADAGARMRVSFAPGGAWLASAVGTLAVEVSGVSVVAAP